LFLMNMLHTIQKWHLQQRGTRFRKSNEEKMKLTCHPQRNKNQQKNICLISSGIKQGKISTTTTNRKKTHKRRQAN
jgi:hypothetical protein